LEIHRSGFDGYSEGFVPTVLNQHGMKLSTLINPDNTSRFFDVNVVNIKHKNITVSWSWI